MLRRLFRFALVLVVVAAAAAGLGLPDYLATRTHLPGGSCLDLRGDRRLCRFDGGPLEVAGTPVFLENFQQAFLPTRVRIDFTDANGLRWTAPEQTLTDGATIPPLFTPVMGDRQRREYLIAAALHDAYCGVGNEDLPTYQTRPWEAVHRMFFEALVADGTPERTAKIMFAAVYLGGPRWDDPERSLEGVSAADLLRELDWCVEWIEKTDPDADEIVSWMREREIALKAGTAKEPVYDAGDPRGL